MREMIAVAQELSSRPDCDAVIVTGDGGCFSAGADLKDTSRWAGGAPLLEQREIASLGLRMARAWEELPQVTIAAIEGYAIGGGLALAVALDWRVVARDAFVSLPEISLGIPLTWGTLPRLVNLVGPAKAKRLSILCERVDADAALRMGLVDEVCDKGMSLEVAQRLARSALEKPRHSVRMTKEAVNAYAGIGAHAVSYMAHDQLELAAASPESRAARDQALRRRKAPPS
jgi:enoyl-CoA hydratase/carnithine racemase